MRCDMDHLQQVHADDIYEHIYEVYTENRPAEEQHLGYVDKSRDVIEISLPLTQMDFTITQSLSSLSSAVQTSSTGFICWQTASYFVDWILSDARCPIRHWVSGNVVLELGAGVSSVLASAIGPLASHYVATDQKHILKLLKKNFEDNVTTQRFNSSTIERSVSQPKNPQNQPWPTIDFMELDWENSSWGVEQLHKLSSSPDLIVACDTIYNSYLIPFFVETLKATMSDTSRAVVAMQLRQQNVTEEFLEAVTDAGLHLYVFSPDVLSDALRKGFVVYCITRNAQNANV